MLLNPTNSTYKNVMIYSLLSCIYMSIFIIFLFQTELVLNIGKFDCFPLIIAIFIGELGKYALTLVSNGNTKMKKNSFKLNEFVKSCAVLICSNGCMYLLAILFGAPLYTEYEETFMFSTLITMLVVFPSCLHLGADNTVSLITGAQPVAAISTLLLQNMRVTLLGAWIGSLFIPLDWDRPWQVWPIPCSIGALLAFITSHALILLRNIPVPHFLTKINIK